MRYRVKTIKILTDLIETIKEIYSGLTVDQEEYLKSTFDF